MDEINLTQAEADALLVMEKHQEGDSSYVFPSSGQKVIIPLKSRDGREKFLLDLYRGRTEIRRVTFQNRVRQVVILARLDLFGSPHRNPDGELIPTPHLHVYREGFDHKWAILIPTERFLSVDDEWESFNEFMQFCNIRIKTKVQRMLFA